MYLKDILKKAFLKYENNLINHHVNSLKDDSRNVKENDIFFAITGSSDDGKKYINDAIKKGAKTIIYEGEIDKSVDKVNYIKVINIKRSLALFAKIFYKDITKKIKLIGITGTNGKTTISTLLFDYLSYSGYDCLLIGTNGIFYKDEHYHSPNTTPNILKTYDLLKEAIKSGCQYMIMEVSSIGIRECRVLYFDFDIIVFTNLNHDHMDYHKNMTDYKYTKAHLLWDMPSKKNKAVILNVDDENFSFLSSLVKSNIITYAINKEATFKATEVVKNLYETKFNVTVKNINYPVRTSLVGGFNIYNILALFAVIDFLQEDINSFVEFLRIYVSVNGRMNKIFYKNKTIIIDFAHTPNSVTNVLSSIREFTNNKITVVIGCGGNRDISKRSLIAEIAVKYADKIIFTTDNPRDEDPKKIINDMVKNLKFGDYMIILNRKEAIHYALNHNKKDEVITILGKGSEREQIINGIRYPFSDKEVVYNWIKKNNAKNQEKW